MFKYAKVSSHEHDEEKVPFANASEDSLTTLKDEPSPAPSSRPSILFFGIIAVLLMVNMGCLVTVSRTTSMVHANLQHHLNFVDTHDLPRPDTYNIVGSTPVPSAL
ncbi:hypothetical protein M422DRAFT_775020 [Sphaerobolus stellatus SS14]|nr:hypothetical protein M422DRAFT_775020 [Sphaerobolus stellatus SS14]